MHTQFTVNTLHISQPGPKLTLLATGSGPGNVVGIATGCAGPSGDRIQVEERFSTPVPDRPWGPPSLLYNGYRVFPGGKERPGCDADPSPPSSAVVKKE